MTTTIETMTPTPTTDTMSDTPMSVVSDTSDAAQAMSDTADTVKTSHDNVVGVALPIVAAVVLNLIGAVNLYSAFAASGLGDLGTAVPVLLCGGLELGIAACAFMAHRLRSNDRASASANALTWILSFVSAYIGYTHAVHLDWEPAVVGVVVGAPIGAATVWHIFLRTNFALAHGRARQDEANEMLVRRAAAARMDSDRAAAKYAKWKPIVWLADVRAYRAERAVTLGATVSEIAPLAARYETAVVRLDAALHGISTARTHTRPAAPRSDTADTAVSDMSDLSDTAPDNVMTPARMSDTSTDTNTDSPVASTERPHLAAVSSTPTDSPADAADTDLSDLTPTVSDVSDMAPEPVATPDVDDLDAADNTDTKELQAAKLVDEGRPVGEVAAKFHVSERTIHRWRKKVAGRTAQQAA